MSSTATTTAAPATTVIPPAARRVVALLERLSCGTLELQWPNGSRQTFGTGLPHASLHVRDWSVFLRVLRSGDIGLAETFIEQSWDTPDLPGLLRLLVANRAVLSDAVYGTWWGGMLYRLRHALNRNSRRGSARNIHAHYDLGNEFYALWLDPTMNYSSAWFDRDFSRSLEQAQRAKMQRALMEAGTAPGKRVLELGCGWGSLARMAAEDFSADVTGITLSREQLDWARQQLSRAGLEHSTHLELRDYRELATPSSRETFDAVVSIEMFEAVGREYWPAYFTTLSRCLKPGGYACVQSITIRDDLFERYVKSTDFIQQYIFPGGLLPSVAVFEAQARRYGFTVERRLAFGTDYAETLRRWRQAFNEQAPAIRALGFDTRFMRLWDFYLAYCEAGFACGNTDVVQFTLRRTAGG